MQKYYAKNIMQKIYLDALPDEDQTSHTEIITMAGRKNDLFLLSGTINFVCPEVSPPPYG